MKALTFATILLGLTASSVFAAIINGTSANNTLNGTASSDTIDGKGGNDTIRGNGGNDRLIGGTGQDVFTGGAGADTFVVDIGVCSGTSCKSDRITDYRKSQGDRIDVPGSPGKLSFFNPSQTGSDRLLIWGVSGSGSSISFKGIVRLVGVGSISTSNVTVF